jgi:hypothetical protein
MSRGQLQRRLGKARTVLAALPAIAPENYHSRRFLKPAESDRFRVATRTLSQFFVQKIKLIYPV